MIFAGVGIPNLKERDATDFLRSKGFSYVRTSGSHQMWRNPEGITAVLAIHGKDVNPNGFRKMLKQIGVSVPEFMDYWRNR